MTAGRSLGSELRELLNPLCENSKSLIESKFTKTLTGRPKLNQKTTMPLTSRLPFTNSPSRVNLYFTTTTNSTFQKPVLSPLFPSRHPSTTPLNSQKFRKILNQKHFFNFTLKPCNFTLKAYQFDNSLQTRGSDSFDLDGFLSFVEILCIVSSAIAFISYALNCTLLSPKTIFLGVIGSNKAFAWGLMVMASGMAIGAWIRWRQWTRIRRETVNESGESVNLVERIEKLEEDVRTSTTIIRFLSRQLEKLGIRFRATRTALKEPIAENAALAQKNYEVTQVLAMQEDILEKELREIQKVLLAMQDQQQKQLDLILTFGKTSKLWESKGEPSLEQDMIETPELTEELKQLETHEA